MTPDTAAIRESLRNALLDGDCTSGGPRGDGTYVHAPTGRVCEAVEQIYAALQAENERLNAALALATRTERERCAKIAREWFDRMIRAGELPADQMRMVKAITAHIARAIEADHEK